MAKYVMAIDQGTTSSRCIVFDHDGRIVSVAQTEHEQIFPRSGWVEHDPEVLWRNTREVAALRLALRDQATRDFVRGELRDLLDELEERGLVLVRREDLERAGEGPHPAVDGTPGTPT